MPCGCASRAIFRACYKRFRDCVMRGKYRSQVSFERASGGRTNRVTWSRKEEEYMADFTLVSRRVLDVWHYRLFRFHFLLGADWSSALASSGSVEATLIYREALPGF